MTEYSGKVIRKTPVTPTQQSASGVWKLNEQAAAIPVTRHADLLPTRQLIEVS